ncbi:MAG TPA: carboxypeptidase-like regulatory domain-containing protein, partial [Armatimonadota bacterium]|nr:carboxypeptidase-like regulatory domain-containing protein [Armatimonadota bacterium]
MRFSRWTLPLLIVLGIVLLERCTPPIAGGTEFPNQIYGKIYLPDSTPVAGALVTLLNADSGEVRQSTPIATVRTDGQGAYRFSGLDEGIFSLTVSS